MTDQSASNPYAVSIGGERAGPVPGSRATAVAAYGAVLREALRSDWAPAEFVPLTVATADGPADAVQAVRSAERLVVVGAPGSGKTTLLRKVLVDLAAAMSDGGPVPIYVDLTAARTGEAVEDLVSRSLALLGLEDTKLELLAPVLLLLDNLDRTTDVYLLEGVELLLRAGGKAGPAVVMACRSREWPAYRSWFEDVPNVEIAPLPPEAVGDALRSRLPAAIALAAERWLARDASLARAVRLPIALQAFLSTVRDRPPEAWRRSEVLERLLDAQLAGIPVAERPAYRAALAEVALAGLGRGPLVDADTRAMALGVSRDEMIRSGVVVASGPKLEFVEPLVAQHCAARALMDQAGRDPSQLADRLGDLRGARRIDTLIDVYRLAPEPVAFLAAILKLDWGPEVAARCLAADVAGAGAAAAPAVVQSLAERAADLPATVLYALASQLLRCGDRAAAQVAFRLALERAESEAAAGLVFHRPDIDAPPPIGEWLRTVLGFRNRGLALRGLGQSDASAAALEEAHQAWQRLGADLAIERGLTAEAMGDLETALECFQAALQVEPDRPRYRFHVGRLQLRLDDPAAAIDHLQRARELAPDQPDVEATLGEAYRSQGWAEEALMSFETASRLDPDNGAYQQAVGELLAELGDLEAAVGRMRLAIGTVPNCAAWLDALGQVLAELGRWSEAVVAFQQAHDADPEEVRYLHHWGRALLAVGEARMAAEMLGRAVTGAPESALLHADGGRALAALGDSARAAEELQRAIALDDGWPADHMDLAVLLRELGDLDGALRHASRAVDLAPASAVALAELGRVHDARGEYRDALAAYSRASVAAPQEVVYRQRMAAAKRDLGDVEGAIQEIEAATGVDATSAPALEQLAQLHEARHDLASALEAWLSAAELSPQTAAYRRRAGEICLEIGDVESAVQHLEKAADLAPADLDLQIELARTLGQAGHHERALGVFRRAVALQPDSPQIWSEVAQCARLLGRLNEARSAVARALDLAPDEAPLHALRAEIEVAEGRVENARQALERAIELAPEDRTYRLRLADIVRTADVAGARELLEQLAVDSADAGVTRRLAALHAREGAWSRAADEFANVRRQGQDDPDLAAEHGTALLRAGRYEEAIAELSAARTRFGEFLGMLLPLADAYAATGKAPEACEAYGRAAELGLRDSDAFCRWSLAACQAGEPDQAIDAARGGRPARPP